ncbi:unnamed protein product [Umbelopsis vinacea]
MYWATGFANELSLQSCSGGNEAEEDLEDTKNTTDSAYFPQSLDIVCIQPTSQAAFFVSCTQSSIQLWSVKPRVVLSHVERSAAHVRDFGKNVSLIWKPDATAFVVITDKNYLLLYVILPFDNASFQINSSQTTNGYIHGPGEGKGPKTMLLKFRLAIRIDAGIACGTTSDDSLIITTLKPSAVQRVSWNPQEVNQTGTNMMSKMTWLGQGTSIVNMTYNKAMNISVWVTSDGRVHFVKCHKSQSRSRRGSKETSDQQTSPTPKTGAVSKERRSIDVSNGTKDHDRDESVSNVTPIMPSFSIQSSWSGLCFHTTDENLLQQHHATSISINARFSLIAIGTRGGDIFVYSAQSYSSIPTFSHKMELPASGQWSPETASSRANAYGSVKSISWTTDGYALAAGYDGRGFAVWSVYGHLLCSSETAEDTTSTSSQDSKKDVPFQDTFSQTIDITCWGAGNTTLFLLAKDNSINRTSPDAGISVRNRLYGLPFAKSAVVLMHSPDNARKGLLQMDDRLLLYNGGDDQESSETIDPDSISWSHIPYASIDSEGKWIAVAGKRGLAHYSTVSGRWKMFGNQQQEQEFHVRGGLVWFRHILIAACEISNGLYGRNHILRFYSRETNLDNAHMLYQIPLKHTVIYMSVTASYLLLYTSDNVLSMYHLTIASENGTASLHADLLKHITLSGIVTQVARVRSITLLGCQSGGQIGSATDLMNARLVLLVDGKLIILSPNTDDREDEHRRDVHYELDILTEKAEYYWVNSKPVGNLRTSIWAVSEKGIKVFTNLITGEESEYDHVARETSSPEELCTNTHGNRPYSLRGLPSGHVASAPYFTEDVKRWRTTDVKTLTQEAVYIPLDFYPLSVLLKKGIIVGIEQNITLQPTLGLLQFRLITKIKKRIVLVVMQVFLDQFPHALDVIVGCARKTEVALWEHLFSIVGNPQDLFELCLTEDRLKTATSYLIIIQTLEPLSVASRDTILLLQKAMDAGNYELSKELVRFLNSIDHTGKTLQEAMTAIQPPSAS